MKTPNKRNNDAAIAQKWRQRADAQISIEQRAALQWFKEKYWSDDEPLNSVSDYILQVALAHPKQLSQWIESHIRYATAEGFTSDTLDLQLVAGRISQQPEYKAVRRKLERGAR